MRTGYNNFSAFAGTNWTSPTNAQTSNDSDASYAAATQDYLRSTNPGWEIPDNAIITGIEVIVEAASATSRSIDVNLTKDGTSAAATLKNQALTGTDARYVFGGSTDLWSATWDIAEINASTFGVLVRDDTASSSDITIDHVQVRVYYLDGVRGEWDVNYTDQKVSHIDSYFDYDGGAGGTTPADDMVVYDSVSGAVGMVCQLGNGNAADLGSLAIAEQHEGTFDNNDNIEILTYVTYDAEANGGFTDADIGSTITASGGGTRTATLWHIQPSTLVANSGTIWFKSSGGTAVQNNDTITLDGTSRTVTASAGETANAWTGLVNGNQYVTPQFKLPYDGETVSIDGGATISGRVRTSNFQHNMCVWNGLTGASLRTAMVVDDYEDPNAPDTGTLFLIDMLGAGQFSNNDNVTALYEMNYITESNGGFAIGDTVTGASSGETGVVRRLIDNGSSGVLYLSAVTGAFDPAENLQVSASTRGVEAGQRARLGAVVAAGDETATSVQWPHSHVFTDLMDLMDELIQMDDTVPMDAQVQDQGYTARNYWLLPHFSTRYVKKGALSEISTQGGADNDSIYTDYYHLGALRSAQNLYLEQGGIVQEQFWDAGSPMEILFRNKVKNGLINGGQVTFYIRPFGETYDFTALTAVGLRNPVPLNTGEDANNATAYATVRDTAVYHAIEIAWASHTLAFTGGSGTLQVGDVIFNTTTNQAVMCARVPDSLASGSDLHVGTNAQDISGWGDAETLDLLDYVDFDGQLSQFIIGEAVENQTDTWNATVRWVQQFGNSRGRLWFSGETGSISNDDTIRLNGAGATRAFADGTKVTANTWTASTSGATPETADVTVLKDIGTGVESPYNVVINLNGCTMLQFYEWTKFIVEERAGSLTDPGSILYPNNTAIQGRLYQKANSAYGAADLRKTALLGTFAGGKFFGARGVFIENMAAGDIQNYELIDSDGVTRNPPNLQAAVVNGLVIGDSVSMFRRAFTDDVSLTYNDDDGTGNSEITRGAGSFIRDGHKAGASVTASGTVSNNGTYIVKSVAALTLQLEGVVLTDEGPVSSDLRGSNTDKETYQGAAVNNDLGDPDFVVQETIASDEPASGTIIVVHTNGSEIYEDEYQYSSFTGSTFTLAAGSLVRTYDADARVYIPLIRKIATATTESQTIIYSADFPVLGVVRRKGIVPFSQPTEFTSTGATVAAVRQTDTIVE